MDTNPTAQTGTTQTGTTQTGTAQTGTANDPRWARVLARDGTADGLFWYSVVTTGVYCRPSCPSRAANPNNVALHETTADARARGFRACRRCHPDGLSPIEANARRIAEACRLIEHNEETPSLADLAQAVALSPGYFHRLFKQVTGLTPNAYATGHRAGRVRAALGRQGSVTEAIYESGFNSSGRFYENATGMLGMTPRSFKAKGADEDIRFAIGQCSLGAILVASSTKGVVAILIGDDPDVLAKDLQDRFAKARLLGGDAEYETLVAQVVGFVEAPGLGLDLPLDIRGSAFQQRVWRALADIPAGRTASYTEIAARLGAPKSVRAVAGACAANPIAVAIPCHRVVRRDGALSGYAWGVERKRRLLQREARP
ncbi:bifunctional DNA-binding transcriptional regulator/O6-methylguanine-DNA methyltransferase Ada [Lichenicoccus sp.]|uniref:bifunctional DNA-binding transcriptional regulator/O6-methylguanine-DNA methyltransferase Ada n=1 Tax=Lichenicoccus sp. TaxID=2781899 RepID=UPI003D0F20A6